MNEYNTTLSRLPDIEEQTEHILSVTKNITFKDFLGNAVYSAAVIRFFEIIVEAVKHIPENIREKYTDIPWKKLAGPS